MMEKYTNRNSILSHQKNAKSMHKHLTRSSVPDTIFSNKQQATSNKQQATSNKQQATSGIKTRSAQTNSQLNTNFLTVHRTHKSESPSLCVFYITPFNKPQGTPNLELRSSPQRNNRNVLRIGTCQSKKNKIPRSFEFDGFLGQSPKQREEEGWGYRGREVTTALNGGSSRPLIEL